MDILQILLNGIVLGTLYACIAIGFSLVWGVLNVINMLHGSFIILGGYLTYFAWHHLGIHPILALPFVAALLFALGYVLQYVFINKVVSAPVLTTLTRTPLRCTASTSRRMFQTTVGPAGIAASSRSWTSTTNSAVSTAFISSGERGRPAESSSFSTSFVPMATN